MWGSLCVEWKKNIRVVLMLATLIATAASAYLFVPVFREALYCTLASLVGVWSCRQQVQKPPQLVTGTGGDGTPSAESIVPASRPQPLQRWRALVHALRFTRLLRSLSSERKIQEAAPLEGDADNERGPDADYLLSKSRGVLRYRRARLYDKPSPRLSRRDEGGGETLGTSDGAAAATKETLVELERWTPVEYRHALAFVTRRPDVARVLGSARQALPPAEIARYVEDFVAWHVSEQSKTPATAALARAVDNGSQDLNVLLHRGPVEASRSLLHALWSRIYDTEAALLGKCHVGAARLLVTGTITLDALCEASNVSRGGGGGIRKSTRATQRDERALHAPHDLQEHRGSLSTQNHAPRAARYVPRPRRRKDKPQRRRHMDVSAQARPDAGHIRASCAQSAWGRSRP